MQAGVGPVKKEPGHSVPQEAPCDDIRWKMEAEIDPCPSDEHRGQIEHDAIPGKPACKECCHHESIDSMPARETRVQDFPGASRELGGEIEKVKRSLSLNEILKAVKDSRFNPV